MENNLPTQSNIKNSLLDIEKTYNKDFARKLEQLIRNETNHFRSTQWLKCGTAGMVATKTEFPYGWGYLQKFCDNHRVSENDFDIVHFSQTSDGKPRNYIKFPSTDIFVKFLASFLWNVRKGDVYSWYSLDHHQKEIYQSRLNKVVPKYIV
ncbi:MAG: hypothetical protein HYR91_06230 [Flavobacteriia bacterium]|nr:hypothetical protein [Flavobacteriia bacterium]